MNNQEHNLIGFSGSKLEIINKNSSAPLVRKTSPSKKYNNRLKSQALKQKNFHSELIKSPKITNIRKDKDGKLYFDMEYIQGETLSEYILKKNFEDAFFFFQKVLGFIKSNNSLSTSINQSVQKKINSIKLPDRFERYRKSLSEDKFHSKTSYCHGDLTLENIIIKDGEVFFIDFLDSDINSKTMDVSKILQDIICMWSWRNITQKPIIECEHLLRNIQEQFTREEFLESKKLCMLNLLRIIPYSKKDTSTTSFLETALKRISCE